ncbi:MAG: hypothetical protein AMQ74_00075 [Candidatus Methanofastidiosum methylothiophilum]|jgi:hypothetical protein|uniref:Uncharacterized protein n=1 Tax=Candidatus Methanofastidiosum methylothiophilum TaxID=1705564 RepID=A0A150JAQ3_9EURY|nr:MAG: hypothetical protein AMQ74_00075 [Candidatus Methanofastidiosum methylthiophilus]NMC77207.1 DUF190 domain-containing protein [Candidatus Methanofastidiosa archaeon]
MKKESDAILLRIFIGESDRYEGKPLHKYLIEMFRREGLSGATVLRGIEGFGKTSKMQTMSILRLSTDLPIIVEVVDLAERIEKIKPKLDEIIKQGLITQEKVKIILYEGTKNDK